MKWVDRQDALDAAIDHIAAQPIVAVDTEADSLHSYFDKVCLVQITAGEEDFIVDPLAPVDLARFGQLLGEPSVTKILHGGDYDVRILNRDFGFSFRNLIDTSICAQLLGYPAFGLAALLERHFGVKLNKAHQRADWAMRPLPADMLAYAAMDTHYLIGLAAKLREELEALGRWEWALEEFSRLENIRFIEKDEDDEPWRRLKNLGALDRRSMAIVRDLHEWRDGLARKADRPPFKVIGNDALVDIGREKPENVRDLGRIKAVSRYHADRYGRDIVARVRKAMELPEEQLPEKNEPRAWLRDKALEARVEKLKKVRDKFAAELKIDGSMLGPRHVLTSIAALEPKSVAELDQVPAMREWQKKLMGEALIAALSPPPAQPKLF
ncbi:MAG TPA: ribonuclease D [Thermoanaerobaculia bacterium]